MPLRYVNGEIYQNSRVPSSQSQDISTGDCLRALKLKCRFYLVDNTIATDRFSVRVGTLFAD